MSEPVQKDIVIIGGGIAGLWLLNRLVNAGYDTVLFENNSLGSGQSIASQGIIHGGIKYALGIGGSLRSASDAIANMPAHWKACLTGEGDVDLSAAQVLSQSYYMWPENSVRSRLNAFLGSMALRGKVKAITESEYPNFFRHNIPGPLYQLSDIVLDIPSLLKVLSQPHRDRIHKIDWDHAQLQTIKTGDIACLLINTPELSFEIRARRYIISCGEGTYPLLEQQGLKQVEMQLRPLQMVMVKHHYSNPVYVHCIADQLSITPALTITTHQCQDGSWIWYLGGELAESGAALKKPELITAAKTKIKELFPWCDLADSQWDSFTINRAEAKQKAGNRPDNTFVKTVNNFLVCWPTKLTLAPNLANEVISLLHTQGVKPSAHSQSDITLSVLPFPGIATTPWDELFL